MSERGAELREKYGDPVKIETEIGTNIFMWAHDSEEAARAFVEANLEDGYEAWVDQREGRWVSVVDLNQHLQNTWNKVVGP